MESPSIRHVKMFQEAFSAYCEIDDELGRSATDKILADCLAAQAAMIDACREALSMVEDHRATARCIGAIMEQCRGPIARHYHYFFSHFGITAAEAFPERKLCKTCPPSTSPPASFPGTSSAPR